MIVAVPVRGIFRALEQRSALYQRKNVNIQGDIGGFMATKEPADVFRYIDMRGDDECWPWLGPWGGRPTDQRPYFQASGRRQIAYRWVVELVQGVTLTADQHIRHTCDRGSYPVGCCNPLHMIVGTNEENRQDMVERQRHGMPKTVVRAIRMLLDQGRTQQEIADLYGVSRETISAIATRRAHRTVD